MSDRDNESTQELALPLSRDELIDAYMTGHISWLLV